jgi:glycosyltransferase involved in cell wall biosynthesis
MIVLTTSFNCQNYIDKSINSIKSQTFKNFKCYITDDLSTDNTRDVIKELIKDDDRFILIENDKKFYQCGNYDQVIRGLDIPDDEICVEVDGDDWLPTSKVFELINETYSNKNVWMTSGSFKYHDGRSGFAKPPSSFNNVRNQTFTLSHIRTWKSWLWKKIKQDDLKDENGNYWNISGDLAFMFPMFEMSGEQHYKFINDICYIYNESNPINEHKVDINNVVTTSKKIRSMNSYSKL